MKRMDSSMVRESGGRRFLALTTFCQGFADGIGSPMFELKQYAWKRGRRCEATEAHLRIERPHVRAGASLDRS